MLWHSGLQKEYRMFYSLAVATFPQEVYEHILVNLVHVLG